MEFNNIRMRLVALVGEFKVAHTNVIDKVKNVQESQVQYEEILATTKTAEEGILLQHADNIKELGSNEELRTAKIKVFTAADQMRLASAKAALNDLKIDLTVAQLHLDSLNTELDILKTVVAMGDPSKV
jgi:hypothetical protein